MRLTWFPTVTDRRPMLAGLVLVLLLGAASTTFGQEPAQQAPPAEKKAVAFQNDVGIVLIYVKAEKTADFEELLTKLKDGLAKAEAPEMKQAAASLKFLKAPNGPAPAGNVLYVMVADPAVKEVEYLVPVEPVQALSERHEGDVRQVDGGQGHRQPRAVRPDGCREDAVAPPAGAEPFEGETRASPRLLQQASATRCPAPSVGAGLPGLSEVGSGSALSPRSRSRSSYPFSRVLEVTPLSLRKGATGHFAK